MHFVVCIYVFRHFASYHPTSMLLTFPSLQKVGKYLPKGFNKTSMTTSILHDIQLCFYFFSNYLRLVNDIGGIIVLHFR